MYFLLADMAERFHLLKYGLAAVLMFIGVKMLLLDAYKISGGDRAGNSRPDPLGIGRGEPARVTPREVRSEGHGLTYCYQSRGTSMTPNHASSGRRSALPCPAGASRRRSTRMLGRA
jgi:hypothetical protein